MMEICNTLTINAEPLHNIVKSNLVLYSNQSLCSHVIDELSLQITETIESFFNKHLAAYDCQKVID